MIYDDYNAGYHDGQTDVLTWLTVDAKTDSPLVAFAGSTEIRASLVCLGRNLAIGAALCASYTAGQRSVGQSMRGPWWSPGCGRPAPGHALPATAKGGS